MLMDEDNLVAHSAYAFHDFCGWFGWLFSLGGLGILGCWQHGLVMPDLLLGLCRERELGLLM